MKSQLSIVEKRAISTTAVNDGKWHHITGTYDGSTVKVYVDAVVGGTTVSYSGDIDSHADEPVFLGQRGNGNRRLKGDLADVRIYSRALSATEITTLKSQILPNDAPTADLVSHWKLNEVGSSTTTTATDSVGSNNGTLTNFVSSPWFGNKATAVAGINHWETVLNNSGAVSLDLPSCTMKSFRDYFSTDNVVAKGDMTFTTELQIDAGTTFNANGNTITAMLADCNSTGTLDLRNSTLSLSLSSGYTWHCDSTFNLLTGATTVVGRSTSEHANCTLPSAGDFEVVGNVKWLKIKTGGDLTVIGSVTDCSFEDSTANIHQWHHTIDTQQLLDADEGNDDDMKLPRPSLDNAHELQTGG